jgi:predicted permease
LHNSNFSNGSHFGRISRRPSAENTQDEATTFAMLDDFRFVFLWSFFMGVIFQSLAAQFIFDWHPDRNSGSVCVIITQNDFSFFAMPHGF